MSARGDEPLPPLPPLPADLPRFPKRIPDRGDLDWKNRRLGDGYDYAQAATAGAAQARAALAAARGETVAPPARQPRTVRTDAEAPFVPPRPLPGPVRGTPARPADAHWTPHDAMPPIPTSGHWADGIPINDEPPPEEDW